MVYGLWYGLGTMKWFVDLWIGLWPYGMVHGLMEWFVDSWNGSWTHGMYSWNHETLTWIMDFFLGFWSVFSLTGGRRRNAEGVGTGVREVVKKVMISCIMLVLDLGRNVKM